MTTPIRHRSEDPEAQVERCRAKVERLRRDVLARKAGASSLHVAEWELACALDRLDPEDAA